MEAINETADHQVAIIQKSIELFRTAPEVLKENQAKTQKALIVGNDILKQWQSAWAMEDEDAKLRALATVDERSNNYLVNCGNALKFQKDTRAAITQMMDNFKSFFTQAENDIDKYKPNTVPSKVQNNRDTYVQEAHKISERKRKEAERIAAKAKEAIEIKAHIELRLSDQYNDYLLQRKQSYTNSFNAITLADYEEKCQKLKALKPQFAFAPTQLCIIMVLHHNNEEIAAFTEEIRSQKQAELSNNFTAEIQLLIGDLIEKLPSKKAELDEEKRLADEAADLAEKNRLAEIERQNKINAANAEEKERLEKEAEAQRKLDADKEKQLLEQQQKADLEKKEREDADQQRLKEEAAAATENDSQKIEVSKQGAQTMVMFEQEATLAETTPAPDTRQGFDLVVLHPVGFTQIFAVWFEKIGKDLPIDKIGNTKLDQMKAWAEKEAHKNGFKIESKFLKYEPTFKAVNKK